jgi:hypothetical protein
VNHGGRKQQDLKDNSVYEKLIQIETLNNLIASFTGICMLMNDIYDKYFSEKENSDLIDNLAYTKMANEDLVKQKIVKEYSLGMMKDRYNSKGKLKFADTISGNIQKGMRF